MRNIVTTGLLAVLFAATASAQAGSFTAFGTACAGTGGTPAIYSTGSPTIGKVLGIHVKSGRNNGTAVMIIGATTSNYYGLLLPFDLGLIGATGCKIYVGTSVMIPTMLNSVGVGGNLYTIPYATRLLGLKFHAQYYLADTAANNLGIITSDAATTVIGR